MPAWRWRRASASAASQRVARRRIAITSFPIGDVSHMGDTGKDGRAGKAYQPGENKEPGALWANREQTSPESRIENGHPAGSTENQSAASKCRASPLWPPARCSSQHGARRAWRSDSAEGTEDVDIHLAELSRWGWQSSGRCAARYCQLD